MSWRQSRSWSSSHNYRLFNMASVILFLSFFFFFFSRKPLWPHFLTRRSSSLPIIACIMCISAKSTWCCSLMYCKYFFHSPLLFNIICQYIFNIYNSILCFEKYPIALQYSIYNDLLIASSRSAWCHQFLMISALLQLLRWNWTNASLAAATNIATVA